VKSLHESDLVLWSEQQAAVFRQLDGTDADVDWKRIAQHLEGTARMATLHVEEALRSTLAQAIAGFCDPGSLLRRQRNERVLAGSAARDEVGPTLRGRIDLDRLWGEAFDIAMQEIDAGPLGVPPLPRTCPLALDELLADDFTYDRAVERLYILLTSWRPKQHPDAKI
jgi:Domain of unknown function DUF29